ncbi:MAG: glycosyltransferase [Myxococcales bacterium]|nr:glycosyltransferase [Myxococcales bacterium]
MERTIRTSFLLPVRNGASTLAAALDSMDRQTVDDWEAVVVDDGSTDDSAAVVQAFAAASAQRVVLVQQPARGIVAALNHGLRHCRGPFVARLDADDIATPQRLERQLPLLEADPSVWVVDGRVAFFRDEGEVPAGMQRYATWVNGVLSPADFDAALSIESPVVHPAATTRRDVLLAHGGYRDGAFPEDYDLWCRLHAAGGRFRKVPEVLVQMRDRPNRLTRTDHRYGRDGFREVRRRWLSATVLRRSRRVVVAGGGAEARQWCAWLVDRGHTVAAVLDVARGRWGTVVGGAPVEPPHHLADIDADVLLVTVSAQGRDAVRTWTKPYGHRWREGENYFFVVA